MRTRAILLTAVTAVSLTGICAAPSASRMDRSKLQVGAYCYRPVGYDERHVREIAECGVDFIIGVDAKRRDVLDLFAKYGVGAFAGGVLSGWWGGDGSNAGKMRVSRPREAYERQLAEYVKSLDHPAIWKIDLCDEPSALDLPYLGETCALIAQRVPQAQAYLNLYPNYASLSTNSGAEEKNQLGTKTYREHIDVYCRTVPLDYISYDFYVYTPNPKRRGRLYEQMYDNFNIVADACRRTGRSFWYIPQVNSHHAKDYEPTTVNRLRFQAYTSMAYGAEVISWACWMPGWWTNNVYTVSGEKTAQYERLRKVNAELHRFGPKYMSFRSTATHFVGFPGDCGLDALGVPMPAVLETGYFSGVETLERTPLVVGEMVPRGRDNGMRALFIVASGDPFDYAPAKRTVLFRPAEGYRARIQGVDGEITPTIEADGTYAFELEENAAALVIAAKD